MKLLIPAQRTPLLIAQLVKVWEASVKATHLFLSAGEIEKIKGYVPDALKNVSHLLIAENGKSEPVAFMGIEGRKIEMLFIAPEERGKGLGRQLIKYGKTTPSMKCASTNKTHRPSAFMNTWGSECIKGLTLTNRETRIPSSLWN